MRARLAWVIEDYAPIVWVALALILLAVLMVWLMLTTPRHPPRPAVCVDSEMGVTCISPYMFQRIEAKPAAKPK